MAMSLPPDLQVLCRLLASTDASDLPPLCPSLIANIHRCGEVLSLAVDQKPKDGAPEHSVLVHKFKTQLTTLLNNGRSQPGRFAAAILIKAVVDVGGYECLRGSEPWVRGLLSILQKNDSFPAKEIAVITLTRIYTLLHEYHALVREVVSRTLADYITACVQISRSSTSKKAERPPLRLLQTVVDSLCILTPLYPTTMRPFSGALKTALRFYLAPTAADKLIVPQTLRGSVRRLIALQPYTTPKNGNAEEWSKAFIGFIQTSHHTANQVFRAVKESWESNSGYLRQSVSSEGEPSGGEDSPEQLPPWHGLSGGAARLVGLLETLSEILSSPTKSPVITPVSALLDLTARITMISPPQKGPQSQDDIQLNSAIGREEKDELWTALPDIHIATLQLLTTVVQRLQNDVVPLAADILHQTIRIIDVQNRIPAVRQYSYILIRELLLVHGPTMPKLSVNSLDTPIQLCCRDLLAASGHAKPKAPPKDAKPAYSKATAAKPSTNADAYLNIQSKTSLSSAAELSPAHIQAASALLPAFMSHVPQEHLKQTHRALVDRTAVLSHNKEAMVVSVLTPYRTRTGKMLASVYPFLVRDYPRDMEIEVLRSNLRMTQVATTAVEGDDDDEAVLEKMQRSGEDGEEEDEEDGEDEEEAAAHDDAGEDADEQNRDEDVAEVEAPTAGFDLSSLEQPATQTVSIVAQNSTTSMQNGEAVAVKQEMVKLSSTLKRKTEDTEEPAAKRIDTGKAPEVIESNMEVDEGEMGDSDSDESVQLNAALEDDDSEAEE
ncbi:rRNA processing/ribosome biogenesis-domain-containing protein [Coniella lustricola]|uniref:Pre-rRNA-processing protein RIX1 n=1 Tax=Coniella lustricola TaxID=2025994 RepID=A0A2T3AK80_9PEZI|nr:rRNA processing/ribosome biogenesis-domain-containing protein [Coniella lustricola]